MYVESTEKLRKCLAHSFGEEEALTRRHYYSICPGAVCTSVRSSPPLCVVCGGNVSNIIDSSIVIAKRVVHMPLSPA